MRLTMPQKHYCINLVVWQYLNPSRLSPYQQMHVWDAANGAHIDFDARMIGF